ncbi:glycosyltransferase family 2 protein [uncultured Tenacibaculum sp.]|uniref:glycosyltransferase family 2 protein n=1 Tax=uncultured Tenacibaculum sp. TaxID=174713 RepID=UPI002633E219|nr:glycosyltransferase family 2 protein [uncultured Tenacibaculum sp.]
MIDNLTVVILTLNEEVNIRQSLKNVVGWAKEVFVLDSLSNDATQDIAIKLGAKVFTREFDNYANQRRYAIEELPIETDWILFLDADEYLTGDLKTEIVEELSNSAFDGYYIKYRFYFLGKWIKYGGYYGTKILRLFKKDRATVSRDMNEHVSVNGKVSTLKNDFIHEDRKGVSDWTQKHNKYATYEALELIKFDEKKKEENDEFANLFGTQPQRKRWIREKIWNKLLPPLIRPIFYFLYRYIIRLGFLDGKQGFIFHFLHAFWFMLLIDVKYLEMKTKSKEIIKNK